jgi:hypothetical protein
MYAAQGGRGWRPNGRRRGPRPVHSAPITTG